ncbi:helix-turn-helix domain-containing protein [Pseudomonas fragariae (ex Marin et al. 2024)]|nr:MULTISPECIES: helix-turn-helix domain-containing protein [Pseudomonas]AKF43563.1 transcriptional regulator, AraC family [Pseudomonas syringae pv. syringae B301D]EXL32116.1 AraC family transcriptional regulator [Pseudomonas syringae pv. syringae str. B301D-R]KTB84115.1 AraC family transcriptional regulator [Pseudomonas syringae pv. syringae PD2774]KWS26411.1 AraC family transcriptional regulator [Pseudomonas syringae pv. syringae]MCA5968750.1 helix-turn-helix domain-containing protein [Pseud
MSIYFDTNSIVVRERAEFWQEVVCSTFVPLECAFPDRQNFQGRLRSHSVAGLGLVEVQACEQTVVRDTSSISRSDDEFVLVSLALEGRAQVSQEGREAILEVGDFAIYDTRRPYRLHFDSAFSQTVVQIPRNSLQQRLCNLEYLTALSMSRDNPLNGLVFDFFTGLAALENRVGESQQARITEQGLDLLAMALSERVKGQAQGSRRSGLLLRIKDHIQANLADTKLSLASVSVRFGVSTRYVSSLFQDEQTSFGRYLLGSRLQRCASDLREPLLANRQISEIAWRWGFSDVAYFSRVFRQRFGVPAREYRLETSPTPGHKKTDLLKVGF